MTTKRNLLLLVTAAFGLLLAVRTAQAQADMGYCCICTGCPEAACVFVDVSLVITGGAGGTCTTHCPASCERGLLAEGACALHTAADCPARPVRAPATSHRALIGLALVLAVSGFFLTRRHVRP